MPWFILDPMLALLLLCLLRPSDCPGWVLCALFVTAALACDVLRHVYL